MQPGDTRKTGATPEIGMIGRSLRWHRLAYFTVLAVTVIIGFLAPAVSGLFWPMMIWTILIGAHYLVAKSLNIDPDWVDERSADITDNAKDLSHIEGIRARYEARAARNTSEPGAVDSAVRGGDETR